MAHPKKNRIDVPRLDARAIGLRIRRLRKARAWNLYDLSRVTGIARMTIACYECGTRIPRLRNAVAVAMALRRKLDYLLLGKGSRRKKRR